MQRRNFLRTLTQTAGSLAFSGAAFEYIHNLYSSGYISKRPPVELRTYSSEAVEHLIRTVKGTIVDEELAWMFENCYPNTLDTTVQFEYLNGKPDTFIITGDIDAMWLRDSTAQVWPYMPLIQQDDKIKVLIQGLINRQVKCILTDPYANAFYKDLSKVSEWQNDQPTPQPGVHERKYELDSLCYVVRLAYEYQRISGDHTIFDADWDKAMRTIVHTMRTEQRKNGESPYFFIRETDNMIDAPVFRGTGNPIRPVGLIASMFRPSDDATQFPFLIPSNWFAVRSLRQLAFLYNTVIRDEAFAAECKTFADEVEKAVRKYGVSSHLHFGKIYAYEVDGYGNQIFMDDANVPSLMSMAYLSPQFLKDPIYKNTRKFILSENNPFYIRGKAAEGQGSPHTGKAHIWPMGIILRAATSTDEQEIVSCIRMLKSTHADTGFMHEAFHKDDSSRFSRSWFAWANTLFGELILKVYYEKSHILKIKF